MVGFDYYLVFQADLTGPTTHDELLIYKVQPIGARCQDVVWIDLLYRAPGFVHGLQSYSG